MPLTLIGYVVLYLEFQRPQYRFLELTHRLFGSEERLGPHFYPELNCL